MRDLLPAEAEAQGRLAAGVLRTFDLHGYQRVSVPAFEYADVLERGLGTIEPSSVLRFVEPETGEVVALRPDMTPQIARLVSTRLGELKGPVRVCYRGSVLRRQHERARHDQQTLQAGIELVGGQGTEADLEVISVCTRAVREQGLTSYVLDLGHGAIATSLLADVEDSTRDELLESLALKDGAELARRALSAGVPRAVAEALETLVSLQGGAEVFERARAVLGQTPAWPHVEELQKLHTAVVAAKVAASIVVDLGETRGAAYYTGPTFQILAEGPGQAVASGGRYDSLYGLFGTERPALGGAIQLDHLRWALGSKSDVNRVRAVVVDPGVGTPETAASRSALGLLREAGISCVLAPEEEALDYARAWRYSHIVRSAAGAVPFRVSRVESAKETDLGESSADQLVKQLRP